MINHNQVLEREELLNKIWGYGGSAGVQELKDKLTSLEDLLDGQGARQEALLDEIERSIREMTKVAQKGRFGLFK